MILPSTQIALYESGGTFYRVSWPATEFSGAKIPAYVEDFATKGQADKAAHRFDTIGLKPVGVEQLPARVLFPHLAK